MDGVRIVVTLKFHDLFFFENDYKMKISAAIKDFGLEHFTFSDVVPKRKKAIQNGFYAIDEAKFIISTLYRENLKVVLDNLYRYKFTFQYGEIDEVSVKLEKIEYFREGYMLSPVLIKNVDFSNLGSEERLYMYGEYVRRRLIERFSKIVGKEPSDSTFFLVLADNPEVTAEENNVRIRSKFKLVGSDDLIHFANILGLGDDTEEGYGMISPYLRMYKTKKSERKFKNLNL